MEELRMVYAGIEMLLIAAMGAMMMMGQQEQPAAPQPEKPAPQPDPNAQAIRDAADSEKNALMAGTTGRQGTDLSTRKTLGSSGTTSSGTGGGGSDYQNSILGGTS